jgi:glycogen debranching enzyme
MTDILLNHMNPESAFVRAHPEAGFNTVNSPHFLPAFYVDKTLNDLSNSIAVGHLPPDLTTGHVDALGQYLFDGFQRSDLRKFFIIDVNITVDELRQQYEMLRMRAVNYGAPQRQNILRTRGIVDDKQYRIGSIDIDVNYACALYKPPGQFND